MKKLVLVGLLAVVVLLLGAASVLAQGGDAMATVMLSSNDELGSFLVGSNGMTLYLYTHDTPGVSNCYDQCAVNWPPLIVGEGETPTLAAGIPGRLGVIDRTDGERQVTYNGIPLYFWVNDEAPGDTTGQGSHDVWFVVNPPLVSLDGNAELGDFLVGANDMTLYMFTNDEPGVSNCYDQCAVNWPPLLIDQGATIATEPGLVGEFGTTERTDGTYQVTFNGMPLYFFVNDEAPGDATGQGARDVWYVVKPTTINVGGNDELGSFLVGPDGMTLYTFANDDPGVSNCYDQCAVNWPPLLVADGETPTAGEGIMGNLGVTERTDGTYQVTYNDQPLYYWIHDLVPGDATGQNVREVWFVVSLDGM